MSDQMTFGDTDVVTSSPESDFGMQRSTLPDGQPTAKSGLGHVHVKGFQPPASEKGSRTNGTYGQIGSN